MPARSRQPLDTRGIDLPCFCHGGPLEQTMWGPLTFQHQSEKAQRDCPEPAVDTDYLADLLGDAVDECDTEAEENLRALLADLGVDTTL